MDGIGRVGAGEGGSGVNYGSAHAPFRDPPHSPGACPVTDQALDPPPARSPAGSTPEQPLAGAPAAGARERGAGTVPGGERRTAAPGGPNPFVGRERELGELRAEIERPGLGVAGGREAETRPGAAGRRAPRHRQDRGRRGARPPGQGRLPRRAALRAAHTDGGEPVPAEEPPGPCCARSGPTSPAPTRSRRCAKPPKVGGCCWCWTTSAPRTAWPDCCRAPRAASWWPPPTDRCPASPTSGRAPSAASTLRPRSYCCRRRSATSASPMTRAAPRPWCRRPAATPPRSG